MSGQMGAMGMAADPRLSIEADMIGSYPNRVLKTLHDPSVKFEEYLHYSRITRGDEERMFGPGSEYRNRGKGGAMRFIPGMQTGLFKPFSKTAVGDEDAPTTQERIEKSEGMSEEKTEAYTTETGRRRSSVKEIVTDAEWLTASRAARTATWSSVFYLITTDILGPFTAPWAMSQLGFGPGAALYTVFGGLAGYSGWQLWHMFMGLDSDRYPVKNYGDLAFRIYGQGARYLVNVLQSLQFFLNVSIIILGSAYGIIQVIQTNGANLCFVVCSLIFTIAGLIMGQIRTLRRFGWLANIAVWINVFTMLVVVVISAEKHPDYLVSYIQAGGNPSGPPEAIPGWFHKGTVAKPWANPYPVHTTDKTPGYLNFQDNIVGLMQAVYSYGGATMFCEIMAEMRRPWDFWKGLLVADVFIYCVYMFYGLFVYGMQGQHTFQISYQGISAPAWQTVCNIVQLITTLIAACLYGNIGIKVLYANIGRDLLNFPPLESTKGKWIWVVFVPIYWVVAMIVSSSIPQFTNFSGLVGAACILQFTYTFPPWLSIGYNCKKDSILPEETFDPNTGAVQRSDGGFKRWARGFKRHLLWNSFDVFYMLGAFVTAILGCYSAIYNMHIAYTTNPNQAAWRCKSPV